MPQSKPFLTGERDSATKVICNQAAEKPDFQPVIKLAVSAASPMTKMQGSPWTTAWHGRWAGEGFPCILVIGEAALAAALITPLIFKHIESN